MAMSVLLLRKIPETGWLAALANAHRNGDATVADSSRSAEPTVDVISTTTNAGAGAPGAGT